MVFSCPCILGSGPPMRTVTCIPTASPTTSINGPKMLGSESRTLVKTYKHSRDWERKQTYFWASAGSSNLGAESLSLRIRFASSHSRRTTSDHFSFSSSLSFPNSRRLNLLHSLTRFFSSPFAASNSASKSAFNDLNLSLPQASQAARRLGGEGSPSNLCRRVAIGSSFLADLDRGKVGATLFR